MAASFKYFPYDEASVFYIENNQEPLGSHVQNNLKEDLLGKKQHNKVKLVKTAEHNYLLLFIVII